MGDDDIGAEAHDPDRHARRRGRATDGRPYVMVLAVAPWTSAPSPVAPAQVPTTAGTGPRR
jgi:hypothetical protein